MKIEKFEDLTFWKESIDISTEIYKIFEWNKDTCFKWQICEISTLIGSNIAQGFERRFEVEEFKKYLHNASLYNSALRSILYIWKDLWYIIDQDFQKLYDKSVSVSKMIWGFFKTFKKD
ncbi:MAG: S23 ribosomal protein [uncultured bacterium (gcode 4)]|uniref:S23 ribosomal protein n=1 Tax=uncultured bacterium (gcode 4) TaxID=1234023 RepID=K2FYA8_9BACT|nr:MAG: S23 ribosomal protein [uncultured bacterium (gcode 4)]